MFWWSQLSRAALRGQVLFNGGTEHVIMIPSSAREYLGLASKRCGPARLARLGLRQVALGLLSDTYRSRYCGTTTADGIPNGQDNALPAGDGAS